MGTAAASRRRLKVMLPPLHAYQAQLRAQRKRFSVEVCHRRFGKTFDKLHYLMARALTSKRQAYRGAYLAPLRSQAKDIAWDMLKRFARPIPGMVPNESELRVDFPHNDSRIQLLGADSPDALRGRYLDDAILDEYAQMRPSVWPEIIRPTLSDRQGAAILGGTPKGQNHFYDLYEYAKTSGDPAWSHALYKASETGLIPASELASARAIMSPEQYAQEYECSFEGALVGAYYGALLQQAEDGGRITTLPYDPLHPVHTGWDLGIGDSTAIWFIQVIGMRFHLVDYYEASGQGLEHYVKVLRDKPYVYGRHYVPHDLEQREWGSGRSRVAMAESLGLRPLVIVPRLDVADGIQTVRALLPRCYFDRVKVSEGLKVLKAYQRLWDDTRQTWREEPYHNWASHGADALRTFFVGYDEHQDRAPQRRTRLDFDPLTVGRPARQAQTIFSPF